mgnify:CR=1 FL=1
MRSLGSGVWEIFLPVVGVELASFAVLKTFDPPPQAFEGLVVDKGITMAHLRGALDAFVQGLFGEGIVTPLVRAFAELFQMHRFGVRIAAQPGFLHGEGQHRCQPGDQPVEQMMDDLKRRPAALRRGRIAIERILAHVEIKGRQLQNHEIEQRYGAALAGSSAR